MYATLCSINVSSTGRIHMLSLCNMNILYKHQYKIFHKIHKICWVDENHGVSMYQLRGSRCAYVETTLSWSTSTLPTTVCPCSMVCLCITEWPVKEGQQSHACSHAKLTHTHTHTRPRPGPGRHPCPPTVSSRGSGRDSRSQRKIHLIFTFISKTKHVWTW